MPSPLVTIVLLTAFTMATGAQFHTVGDMGQLPTEFPGFALPNVPFNLDTFRIILPYALTLAMIGLLESLMTAAIIDEMTDTTSDKNRECSGQGLGNIVSGLFGGMAGCAMIGQSVINVSSGGRGRLSCLWAGAFLLFLMLVLGDWVTQIPMAGAGRGDGHGVDQHLPMGLAAHAGDASEILQRRHARRPSSSWSSPTTWPRACWSA